MPQSNIHHFTSGTPIYYIIAERKNTSLYGLNVILDVIEMFEEDLINNTLIAQEITNKTQMHYANGKQVNTYLFLREPNNPFRSWDANAGVAILPTSRPVSTGPIAKSVDDAIREASQNADYNSSDAW